MKLAANVLIAAALATGLCHADEIKLSDGTTLVFASANEGRRILGKRDDFAERTSPFDRAARMKTARDVSEHDFLDFVERNVLDWTPREKERLSAAIEPACEKIAALGLPLPERVWLVKTTGKEEGGAGYTRGEAIVYPKSMLSAGSAVQKRQFCHELFHVLSRTNPDLRDRLYEIIGFEKCDEIELPDELQSRKITNPDAPRNDHCIRLTVDGQQHWAVPILLSKSEKYNVRRRDEFFHYLRLYFLLVERRDGSPRVRPLLEDGKPRLATMREVSGFFEQVGHNTGYIIHPEEILADNFVLMVLGGRRARTPEIPKKMTAVFEANGQGDAR